MQFLSEQAQLFTNVFGGGLRPRLGRDGLGAERAVFFGLAA